MEFSEYFYIASFLYMPYIMTSFRVVCMILKCKAARVKSFKIFMLVRTFLIPMSQWPPVTPPNLSDAETGNEMYTIQPVSKGKKKGSKRGLVIYLYLCMRRNVKLKKKMYKVHLVHICHWVWNKMTKKQSLLGAFYNYEIF